MNNPYLRPDYFELNRTQHFVRFSSKEERIALVERLEEAGFICRYHPSFNRNSGIIDYGLPLVINMEDKTIRRIGNVTCAACACSSKVLLTADEFIEHYL